MQNNLLDINLYIYIYNIKYLLLVNFIVFIFLYHLHFFYFLRQPKAFEPICMLRLKKKLVTSFKHFEFGSLKS